MYIVNKLLILLSGYTISRNIGRERDTCYVTHKSTHTSTHTKRQTHDRGVKEEKI